MALPLCHVDPYTSDNNHATAEAIVGMDYTHLGNVYGYGKNAGSGDGVAGELIGPFLTTPYPGHFTAVSTEWTDGTLSTLNPAMGMLCYASTAGRYAYFLKRGYTTTDGKPTGTAMLKTDGGVVKGDYLVPDGGASPDGNADTAADGEEEGIVGYAIDDDTAGSVVIAMLNIQP